jgi:glycosyltransferase involved in cell wall biosynthesis
MFFSVIIPSYNRKNELDHLLESLEKQSLPVEQYEVVVVDDGSTDGTAEWIGSFQAATPLHLRFFQQDHRGPGAARNCGAEKAAGRVLVFTDSDCIVPNNWLAEIKRVFDSDPVVQAFGGPDDASPDFLPLLKAINYSMTSFLTTGGMRGSKRKRLAKYYPRSFNMGLRRELYQRSGGFGDLRHGQDVEFSRRIVKSGAKIAYIPNAPVFHKRRASLGAFFKQVFNWGVARINLYRIDHAMLEPLHFAPAAGFWLGLLFTISALLLDVVLSIWLVAAGIVALVLIGCGVDAAIKWKSVYTGLLVPIVMAVQISGYGLGFTYAFILKVILRRG